MQQGMQQMGGNVYGSYGYGNPHGVESPYGYGGAEMAGVGSAPMDSNGGMPMGSYGWPAQEVGQGYAPSYGGGYAAQSYQPSFESNYGEGQWAPQAQWAPGQPFIPAAK